MRIILKMKKRDIMKNLVSIHILCLLFLIACANNSNQISESLSSSYDGIWDGYAQTSESRVYIRGEIKNGIVSGSIEGSSAFVNNFWGDDIAIEIDREINGYINSDNNLIIKPIHIYYTGHWGKHSPRYKYIIETNYMSPDRIEGTYYYYYGNQSGQTYKWYVVKPATGKSDSTVSNAKSW